MYLYARFFPNSQISNPSHCFHIYTVSRFQIHSQIKTYASKSHLMAALFFFQMLILLKTCSCFSYVIISTSPDGSGQVCLDPLLRKRDCSNSQQERETGIFLQCFGTLAVLWNYVGRNALYVFLENVFHSMIRGIHVAFILKDIICCSFFWSFFFSS